MKKKLKLYNYFSFLEIIILVSLILIDLPILLASRIGTFPQIESNNYNSYCSFLNFNITIVIFFLLFNIFVDLKLEKPLITSNLIISRKKLVRKKNRKNRIIFLRRIVLKIIVLSVSTGIVLYLMMKLRDMESIFIKNNILDFGNKVLPSYWYVKKKETVFLLGIVAESLLLLDIFVDLLIYFRMSINQNRNNDD